MNELIKIEKGNILADSRMVAEHFDKRHDNVMADIRDEIEKLGNDGLLIFQASTYINQQNKSQPCFTMGEKGLMQIAARYDAVARYKLILLIEQLKEHATHGKMQILSLATISAEIETLIGGIVQEQIEKSKIVYADYVRPKHSYKLSLAKYIKQRLGLNGTTEEFDLVKQRVLIQLKADTWEDVPYEMLVDSLDLIDDALRVIKRDRIESQLYMFDHCKV